MAHPLINASGTLDLFEAALAFGPGFLEDPPVACYVPKTVTRSAPWGNEPPRILETAAGMLNAIGLPNGGVETFVAQEVPRLLALPRPLLLNVGGFSVEDYVVTVEMLRAALDRHDGRGRRAGALAWVWR